MTEITTMTTEGQPGEDVRKQVAFLGPFSSYSHQATKMAFPGQGWELIPTETIKEVFDAVQSGRTPFGVVPFENSTHGTVTFTLDGLADRTSAYADVAVCAEVYLDVHHFLLGHLPPPEPTSTTNGTGIQSPGTSTPTAANPDPLRPHPRARPLVSLKHITRVYSHPQAFGQTAAFLATYLRGVDIVDVSSTSRAAAMAAADASGTSAAIAGEIAGEANGLGVLARCIEDREDNVTRFFVIRREDDGEKGGGQGGEEYAGRYKSLVSFTVPHRTPGALADVLDAFRRAELNLTSINSLPSLDAPFQYLFFVEFEGSRFHDPEGRVRGVFEVLEKVAQRWRWLGSWGNQRRG
ncbi:Prephenate dehydratase-domain-containing protein [Lasiosphaeria hispida]|uniref:prephenate dehydratase n=1 Tax=Lasiosphaeria hispida TaxID=260671 RepID=A0AAJ0HMU8_9PEZI|nr:Prephenate dehydratase-domain-containing protein [Lasiosphaeria hispida]